MHESITHNILLNFYNIFTIKQKEKYFYFIYGLATIIDTIIKLINNPLKFKNLKMK